MCLGVVNGNAETFTTRSPDTPNTAPFELTTALGSLSLPIAPSIASIWRTKYSNWNCFGGLHVAEAWWIVPVVSLSHCNICSSVYTASPRSDSGPMVIPLTCASWLARLKAWTATSWLVAAVRKFGLIIGRSLASADEIVTFPLDVGAMIATRNDT